MIFYTERTERHSKSFTHLLELSKKITLNTFFECIKLTIVFNHLIKYMSTFKK